MKAAIIGKTVDDKEINLHLPSAGKRKKHAILSFNQHFIKINDNKSHQKLIVLGNYNMDTVQLQKFMLKCGLNLVQCQVENSSGSHYNRLNVGQMLLQINICHMQSCDNVLELRPLEENSGVS
ncbi:hypothetical protein BB561_002338 [Smittium simulii]|uniref:Uncharacterized protein n=1 Tax=Smittium simulii TaxID=133385 RepID=A0A2T9YQX0_9FUNG|nr:hypothetical protein BB561_002338 [Smittium simulii]